MTELERSAPDAAKKQGTRDIAIDGDGSAVTRDFNPDAGVVSDSESSGPFDAAESLLVEQARQDPNAFGELYERYVERIYAYIYHRVGNVQEAEDLTARTFYRALDKLDTYEDRGAPFSSWLFRIAHNLTANWHRDNSRPRFLSLDRLWSHSHDHHSPQEHVEREENREALWVAINRLPEDRRNLLIFKFGSRMSNVEIGQLMDKSESAIKSLYFRTLAALRRDLESSGWESSNGATEDNPSATGTRDSDEREEN